MPRGAVAALVGAGGSAGVALWLGVSARGSVLTGALWALATLSLPPVLDRLGSWPRMASIARHGIIALFCAVAIFPVLRVVSVSLRPGHRLMSPSLDWIPDGATLQWYVTLLADRPFLLWARNSLLVATVATLIGVSLASTAGYGFSRFRFPGRKAGLLTVMTTQMFPATMLLLPLFVLLARLHLVDTFLGLGVIYVTTALPFSIWLMKGYYDTIPPSLEEAALIDGASRWQAFVRVILPLATPALAITALFSFMNAWTDYIVAAQVLQDESLFTLPIGLKSFQSSMKTEWGLYAAAALVVSAPVVALFVYLNRYLVSGLTLGGVKD